MVSLLPNSYLVVANEFRPAGPGVGVRLRVGGVPDVEVRFADLAVGVRLSSSLAV